MIRATPPLGPVIAVNLTLLSSLLLAVACYWCWPSNPEWWGFGFISICLGGAALGQFLAALRLIAKLYTRETTIRQVMAQGELPKTSRLASDTALKDAGLIDE